MDDATRRGRAVGVSLVLIPVAFFAILFGWGALDHVLGTIEVSRFIREHEAIVARRLTDAKVYSFSLSHAPEHSATLLVRFDVDDKATFLRLEDDLKDHWGLRYPAEWETRLRSEEDLGENYGFAVQGMREVAIFVRRIMISAVASIVLAGTYLAFALGRGRPVEGGE
jgi:hypothetical protein